MTAPNIRSPGNIIGKTYVGSIGGTNHDTPGTLINNSNSDKVYKINAIIVSSIGSLDAEVSIDVIDADADTRSYLAKKIDVPPRSAQVISTKKTYFYLEENFRIRAARTGGTINTASITISYEIIS